MVVLKVRNLRVKSGIKLYVLKMCFILNVLNYYVCLLSFSLHD